MDAHIVESKSTKKFDHEVEIAHVRVAFRQRQYLCSNLMKESKHFSLSGNELETNLIHFTTRSKKNFQDFIDCSGISYEHDFVYVTKEEKEEAMKIENKTKEQIKSEIFKIIASLGETIGTLYYECFLKEVKNKNKKDFISFYYKLIDIRNNIPLEAETPEENDSQEPEL